MDAVFFPYQIASQRYGTIPNAPNCDTSPKYEAYKEWGQRWWLKHLVICRYIHTVLGFGEMVLILEMLRPSGVWRNDASHLNHSGKYVAWIWGYTVKQYFAVASVASFNLIWYQKILPFANCRMLQVMFLDDLETIHCSHHHRCVMFIYLILKSQDVGRCHQVFALYILYFLTRGVIFFHYTFTYIHIP